jgi:hypothetical protein
LAALAVGVLATALAGASTVVVPNVPVFVSHDSGWLVRVEPRSSFSNSPTATAHWHLVDGTGEYRRKVTAPLGDMTWDLGDIPRWKASQWQLAMNLGGCVKSH